MAWSVPLTAVANSTLTAAQWNASVRDNLNETAVAKASTVSGYFVSTGANSIAERVPQTDRIEVPAESTTSLTYTNLASPGPSVTVTTGARALYSITSRQQSDTDNGGVFASLDITGASSIPGDDQTAILVDGLAANNSLRMSVVNLQTDLSFGSNTFTMQYRVSGGEGTYQNRHLVVLPL